MNERVICEKSDLVAIANSVREVTGSTDTYNVPQLKEYIADTIKPVSRAVPGLALDTSNGIITAETNQEQGYVAAGQESITMSLPTQGATTITPTTEPQTAVSAGTYVTGDIVVEAAEGGGGDALKAIIERTITEFEDDSIEMIGLGAFYGCTNLTSISFPICTNIGSSAFAYCANLTSVSFPMCACIGEDTFFTCINLTSVNFPICTSMGAAAFQFCSSLTSVSFPMCTRIRDYTFQYCSNLTSVNFPVCTSIGYSAFAQCPNLASISFPTCAIIGNAAFSRCLSLTTASFPACTNISSSAFFSCSRLTSVNFPVCVSINRGVFNHCYNLSSLILGASRVCTLANSSTFVSTPFAGYSDYFSGTPYIYVPASLLTSYQTATNWVYFSSYFSTIESLEGTT